MARPIWKGYITFGLVTIPVILFSAEKKSDIQFNLVDTRDKSKIRYIRVNEHTGEEVPWQNIAKGYEYNDHGFILIKDEDIKSIAGENTKTINIESFVDKKKLDYMDLDKPYYLVPDKKGEKGYVILRETLENTNKVGIAKVIIHTRQYLSALMPYKSALILNLLRYHHEIRQPSEFDLPEEPLKNYHIAAKEMDIAKQLVNAMSMPWKPNEYKDEFKLALEKYIQEKIHHQKPRAHLKSVGTSKKKNNVINFVDLLKKSLKEGTAKKKKSK